MPCLQGKRNRYTPEVKAAGTQGRRGAYPMGMILTQKGERNHEQQLRLWPGVAAVVLQWFGWLGLPIVAPDAAAYGMLGGIVGGGLAVLVWWLFFSRAAWLERLGA